MGLFYFLVSLCACLIGAISGMGGGAIIKPVLDALGDYPLANIGILSSGTVLTMTIVSIARQVASGIKINGRIITILSVGSIFGGYVGNRLVHQAEFFLGATYTGTIQTVLLLLLMIGVFISVENRQKWPDLQLKNPLAISLTGLALGGISAFLGIGGGPFNIPVLAILFGLDRRTTATSSLAVIFFAQVANLATVALKGGFADYDLHVLPLMMAGAVIGGLVGSRLAIKMSKVAFDRAFQLMILCIIALNVYNLYNYLYV